MNQEQEELNTVDTDTFNYHSKTQYIVKKINLQNEHMEEETSCALRIYKRVHGSGGIRDGT